MERLIADISVSGGVWFSRPPWALGCRTCLCDPRDRWLGSDCVRQGFPIGSVSISHILGFLAYIIVPVPCTYNQSLSRCNWSAEYAREAVCWASPGSSHITSFLRWKSGGRLSPWSSLFFTWYTVLRKDWLNQDDKLFKPLNCFVEIQSRNIYMQLCDFAEHLHWFWCDARCFKGPNFLVLASITWLIWRRGLRGVRRGERKSRAAWECEHSKYGGDIISSAGEEAFLATVEDNSPQTGRVFILR